jgi:hypothetical protein
MVGRSLMQDAQVEFCGGCLITLLITVLAISALGQEAEESTYRSRRDSVSTTRL